MIVGNFLLIERDKLFFISREKENCYPTINIFFPVVAPTVKDLLKGSKYVLTYPAE